MPGSPGHVASAWQPSLEDGILRNFDILPNAFLHCLNSFTNVYYVCIQKKKDIQKIKMNKICLKFDTVIISSIMKMRVFGG